MLTDNLLSGYIRIIYYPDFSGYPRASLTLKVLWCSTVGYPSDSFVSCLQMKRLTVVLSTHIICRVSSLLSSLS